MAADRRHIQPSWSQLWQMPTLLMGVVLLGVGIYFAVPQKAPDDFPGALDTVQTLIETHQLEEAQKKLDEIHPFLDRASALQQGRHSALYADQMYLFQTEQGLNNTDRHRFVIASYQKARDNLFPLQPPQIERWADTHISLGDEDKAQEFLEELPDNESNRKLRLLRRMIDKRLAELPQVNPARVAPLISQYNELLRLVEDPDTRRKSHIWLAEVIGRMRLAANDPNGAIDQLMLRYQRLNSEGGDADLGSLMVQFGNAYLQIGQFDDAERYFLRASETLEKNDSLNAEALIGLAQVKQLSQSDDQQALELYRQAVQDYPATPPFLRALIGLADAQAKLDYHPEALQRFHEAVTILTTRRTNDDANRELATNIIRSLYDLNFDRGDYDRALDYLTLLKPLYKKQRMPEDLIWRFALTHEEFAQKRREDARAMNESAVSASGGVVSEAARRLANVEAAESYAEAADYFHQHSKAVSGINNDAHAQSLWRAGQCYDHAELWQQSIQIYNEFVQTTSENNILYLKAIHNLGLAYMADGQYAAAAQKFQRLIDDHKHSLDAYASLVPLARCHDRLGQPDDAIRVLTHVVTDHPALTPDSMEYREALIELGRVHYKNGQYEQAIGRLTEAVKRYGDTRRGAELRFLLADAQRNSAEQITRQMNESIPESRRVAYRMERAERLEEAQRLYKEALDLLESRSPDSLSTLEKLYHRNAFFYQADCAFDLGRYDEAIHLYDLAARRWEREPASLIALVQIVNAYCEQGQFKQARQANERASWQFKNIPDSAFDDENLPMKRKHWENWLRWTNELKLFDAQANVTPAANG